MVKSASHGKEKLINIGIDLGTTNSAVAVHQKGSAQVCEIDGHDIFPSAIYLGKRGGMMHGKRAYLRMAKSPQNVASGFKRELGTSWEFSFNGTATTMTAEECSAEILQQLISHAKASGENQDVEGAVITTPAAFTQPKLEATKRAADKAGISRVKLLQEPIAASMAVMAITDSKDTQFLVYDIGGGTLDLAIVSCVRGNINIIGHEGVELFGGRDFDRKITDAIVCPWLLENFALPSNFQASEKFLPLIRQLRFAAEEAKIVLSTNDEATIYASEDDLRIVDDNDEDIVVEVSVRRSDYEQLISDKILESVALTNKLLSEHGYSSQDMDKVVFIGGPTKTPCIREIVSTELGIPADMSVDPMTAVALGAAIFCESRDWSSSKQSTRKKARTKLTSQGEVEMDIGFPARTSDDRAQIKLQPSDATVINGLRIQIESEEGWASGWRELENDMRIEVPVGKTGDNKYRMLVVDSNNAPVENSIKEIVITRVAASISAISAPHAVAIKVAKGEAKDAENTLHTIVEKGSHLPAKGEESYRAAKDLGGSNGDDQLSIELFEQPDANNKTIGEPNLFIGSCIIQGKDLDGNTLHKGDIVKVLWEQDESGLIRAAVSIPSVGKTFDSHNFFISQLAASRRTFGGEEGKDFVATVAKDAKREAQETKKVVDESQQVSVRSLENEIEKQLATINSHSDSETQQEADNKIREIRQKLFALRNNPKNNARSMRKELEEVRAAFQDIRNRADEEVSARFDDLAGKAENAIKNDDEDAKMMLEELQSIVAGEYYSSPEFLTGFFNHMLQMRPMAIDQGQFDRHVIEGKRAISNQDIDQLRMVVVEMRSNIVLGDDSLGEQERRIAADIMHS